MGLLTRYLTTFGFILLSSILLASCQNTMNEEDESLNLNEEELNQEDLDTLISTNEKLVNQLEENMNDIEMMRDEITDLEEENAELREDLLTYRQQMLETEQYVSRYQDVQLKIDELTRSFFLAMHNREHSLLNDLSTDRIETDSDRDLLVLETEEDIKQSFHYLQIDSFRSMRQMNLEYDRDDAFVHVKYGLYTMNDESFVRSATVNIEFINENDEWLVDHIQYQ